MPASLALRFQSQLGTRAADTRVATWREDDLSIEAVAATEHPTRMRIFDDEIRRYRDFDEILDVSALTEAEISGFVGCPILDSHSAWSSMTIVGVVDEAKREGSELIVRFRLSETEEDIVSKVRNGIIRKVSIGYQRKSGAVITERDGDVPLRRQPFVPAELSLVAIGADPNAGTRSATNVASLASSTIPSATPAQEPTMNVDAIRSAAAGLATAVAALQAAVTTVTETPPADQRSAEDIAAQAAIEGARAAPAPVVTATVTTPAAVTGQRSAADEAAILGLRSVAKDAGREAQFNAFVAAGETVEGLRALARSYVTTTSPETNGTTTGSDGQRSAETFISFDEAVTGRRSAQGGDVQALAAALAGFVAR